MFIQLENDQNIRDDNDERRQDHAQNGLQNSHCVVEPNKIDFYVAFTVFADFSNKKDPTIEDYGNYKEDYRLGTCSFNSQIPGFFVEKDQPLKSDQNNQPNGRKIT